MRRQRSSSTSSRRTISLSFMTPVSGSSGLQAVDLGAEMVDALLEARGVADAGAREGIDLEAAEALPRRGRLAGRCPGERRVEGAETPPQTDEHLAHRQQALVGEVRLRDRRRRRRRRPGRERRRGRQRSRAGAVSSAAARSATSGRQTRSAGGSSATASTAALEFGLHDPPPEALSGVYSLVYATCARSANRMRFRRPTHEGDAMRLTLMGTQGWIPGAGPRDDLRDGRRRRHAADLRCRHGLSAACCGRRARRWSLRPATSTSS